MNKRYYVMHRKLLSGVLPKMSELGHKLIKGILWLPLLILNVLRQLCYGIVATPSVVGRSPLRLYRKAARWRDVEGSVLTPAVYGS